jgi:hypothetical protein
LPANALTRWAASTYTARLTRRPGMREMLGVTALVNGLGMGAKVALVTDGRFSRVTSGVMVGYIGPEAARGGPAHSGAVEWSRV